MSSPRNADGGSAERGATQRALSGGGRLLASPFLSDEERELLAAALSPPRRLEARTELVREGDRTELLFIVTEGWACRHMTTRDGARMFPTLLVAGDIGNLDSLMLDRLDYGVRTLTAATVAPLPRERALALAARHPGIARAFTWLAMVENTTLSRWALLLGRQSSRERLAHLLCELSVRLGAAQDGESRFGFPLTQEHMADALGLTSVHVNRTLRQLRADGLVEIADRVMTLPDIAQLRAVSGFDAAYLHAAPREVPVVS